MNEKNRAKIVLKNLNKIYPEIKVPLKSRNVFTLLISVLLSAQCTDVNVNNVTKNIYPKYYKPNHFLKLGRKRIEILIKKIGIFRIKAKSIYNLSKILVKKYKGKVNSSFKPHGNGKMEYMRDSVVFYSCDGSFRNGKKHGNAQEVFTYEENERTDGTCK